MRLTAPLPLVFAMIVSAGCPDVEPESSCPEDGGPDEYSDTRDIQVTVEEYEAALDGDGVLSDEACMDLCRASWQSDGWQTVYMEACEDMTTDPEDPTLSCEATVQEFVCEGRAHQAVRRQDRVWGPTAEARWLARATHAEASSVGAFLALARELEAHGAPQELIDRARDAALDEIAHARMVGALARQQGGRTQPLRFAPPPERSLEALAIENAVEACVGETWSALVATWQAQNAPSQELRQTFSQIAADETRHAELARDLQRWAFDRLDAAAQERVLAAQEEAWDRLLEGLEQHQGLDALGLPDPERAVGLARSLRAAIA